MNKNSTLGTGLSYGDQLRRNSEMTARIRENEEVERLTAAVLPRIRDAQKSASSPPIVRSVIQKRKTSSPPPPPPVEPARSPPSKKRTRRAIEEEEQEEEEEEEGEEVSAEARNRVNPIASVTHEPHATRPESGGAFVPFQDAVDATEAVNAYYRRMSSRVQDLDMKQRCFMCEYGNKMYDNSPDYGCKPYVALLKMVTENYSYATNRSIGYNMYGYYVPSILVPSEIYKKRHNLTDEQFSLPEMSVELFEQHITSHHLNPIIMVGEEIRRIEALQAVVLNRVVNSKSEIDNKAISSYAQLSKAKLSYMTAPKNRFVFGTGSGEGFALDMTKIGLIANTKRVDSLFQSASNAIGGQTASDAAQTTGDQHRVNFAEEALPSHESDDEGNDADDDDDDDDNITAAEASLRRTIAEMQEREDEEEEEAMDVT